MQKLSAHLIDFVENCEPVEYGVHVIEHGDDLHGRNATADLREVNHVREQDGDALEHLGAEVRSAGMKQAAGSLQTKDIT